MRTILVSTCSVILASLFCISFDVPTAAAVSNVDGVWSALSPGDPAPSARREYAALYDRAQGRYIVFAGFTNEQGEGYFLFNEVWTLALDGTPSWSQLAIPGDIPGGRHSPQWGYDPANNRVLVFGGYGSHYPGSPYAYLNDVWELKLDGAPNWNEIFPNAACIAALLDRLTHHTEIAMIEGRSFRVRESEQEAAARRKGVPGRSDRRRRCG